MKKTRILSLAVLCLLCISLFSPVVGQATPTQASAADTLTTLLIECASEPLAAYADASVADYISSDDGRARRIALQQERQSLVAELLALCPDAQIGLEFDITVNGFSVTLPSSQVAQLRALQGIQGAYTVNSYTAITPNDWSSNEVIQLPDAGYTGAGMVIAVLDSGFDVKHPLLSTIVSAPNQRTRDDIQALFTAQGMNAGGYQASMYVSAKIPFAYDYADRDTNVVGIDSHGTHVAGIAAGSAVVPEGYMETLRGVAPDAQLYAMKVFSDHDGSTRDDILIAALEDAILLGADVINMSLGLSFAPASTFSTYALFNRSLQRAQALGISVVCAAGNDGFMTSTYTGLIDARYPDYGTVNSPSTLTDALSVASCYNKASYSPYFLVGTQRVVYSDSCVDYFGRSFASLRSGAYPIVAINGLGTPDDFKGLNMAGTIALVQRGELLFSEKANNAAAVGAVAIIVYDNTDDELLHQDLTDAVIPSIFISKADGEALKALCPTSVTFDDDYLDTVPLKGALQIAGSSSYGPTADLKLKPDITFPGGNILSSVNNSGYGVMSGTSMASPHASGAMVLVKQYVQAQWPSLTAAQIETLATQLLISTAKPLSEDTYYSPRQQGAGLADVTAALTADTVAYDATTGKSKLELGDGLTNTFKLAFTLDNRGNKARSYTLSVAALYDKWYAFSDTYAVVASTAAFPAPGVSLMVNGKAHSGTTVTVPANGTLTLSLTVTVDQARYNELMAVYTNGTYIDGFVFLDAADGSPDLSLPYLGFFGSWAQAPVLDDYDIYSNLGASDMPMFAANALVSAENEIAYNQMVAADKDEMPQILGASGTYTTENGSSFTREYAAFSPNNDKSYDFCAPLLALLRPAKSVSYVVRNAEGAIVYSSPQFTELLKYYGYDLGREYPMRWYGNDNSGRALPDGHYFVTVTVVGAASNRAETWTTTVAIDRDAPKLTQHTYDAATGKLTVKAIDGAYIKAITLQFPDGRGAYGEVTAVCEYMPSANGELAIAVFSLPELLRLNQARGKARLTVYDYAGNTDTVDIDLNSLQVPVFDVAANGVITTAALNSVSNGLSTHSLLYLTDTTCDSLAYTLTLGEGVAQLLAEKQTGVAVVMDNWTLTLTAAELQQLAQQAGTAAIQLTPKLDDSRTGNAHLTVAATANGKALSGGMTIGFVWDHIEYLLNLCALDNGVVVPDSGSDGERAWVKGTLNTTYELALADVEFHDTSPYTNGDMISFLAVRGVLEGNGSGYFYPAQTLSRAEVIKMFALIAGVDVSAYQGIAPFDDVKADRWYAPYVAWAVDNGITEGVGGNRFNPHAMVTKQEVALFIVRLAGLRGTTLPVYDADYDSADNSTAYSGARQAITQMVMADIMNTDSKDNFNPLTPVRRDDAAYYFYRYMWVGIMN